MIRLQKHIADLGICSRRKAEELISIGKVKLNGQVVTAMGIKVDPKKDKVEVQMPKLLGVELGRGSKKLDEEPTYIAINKPIDYISSTTGNQGKSVLELLTKENNIKPKFGRDIKERVYPVGRLDKDSEGLVILTNDGKTTNQLTHPSYEHKKVYELTIDKPLSQDAKKVLETGMNIDGKFMHGIIIKKEFNKGRQTIITVELKEGKNRQIRKMFGRLGYSLTTLKRIQIGKLKLGTLPPGRWKFIEKSQIV